MHNPEINWKANSIQFSCCDSGCLGLQFTILASTLVPAPSSGSVGSEGSDSIDVTILSANELFCLEDISHLGLIYLPLASSSPAPCSGSHTFAGASLNVMDAGGNPLQSLHDSIAAKVPAKYHDFLDLFVDKEVTELLPHWSHNIKIELEQGKSPPFGLIYTLT